MTAQPRADWDWVRWLAAAAALGLAGWIHLAIAPEHYSHAAAHGLFFGIIGAGQLGWVVAALLIFLWPRLQTRMSSALMRTSGIALGGGAVILWILTQLVRTPFAGQPEPIDLATIASKAAELLAAGCLVLPAARKRGRLEARSLLRSLAATAAAALVFGWAMWAAGLEAEERFPALIAEEHSHEGGEHQHADPEKPNLSFVQYVESAVGLVARLASPPDYEWNLPGGFPPPKVPESNPMTREKVELGRHLFYDKRLSGNGQGSCSSCHQQEYAFSDDRALAVGSTGEIHPRNSMALVNVAYNATLTWAHPDLEEIEKQVAIPMFGTHPVEMGITGHEEEVLNRFVQDPLYGELFGRAFPQDSDPVNWGNIISALASFTRSLVSGNSPYDRFVFQGDSEALTPSAKRGMELFLSEDFECHHCHGGFNFSTATVHAATAFPEKVFHNTGLYNLGGGAYPSGNGGVFEVTHRNEDMGKFRPPTLRNVAVTAPYMHDGSIATLEEVIETYASGGRLIEDGPLAGDGRRNPHKSGFVPGFPISEQEKSDLLAFLRSLTDETFLKDQRHSDPFQAKQVPAGSAASR